MRSNSLRLSAMAAISLCAALLWLGSAGKNVRAVWLRQEPGVPAESRQRPEFLVIVDASHGGDDKGATLNGKLLEKDLTLAMARLLRVELEDRGVAVRMVRESDVSVTLERRAEVANEVRPNLYIALHAGAPGQGARVYVPAVAQSPAAASGPFLPWESAQTVAIEQSKSAAVMVTAEIRKTGIAVSQRRTRLRPLNNVTVPAIAVEWAVGPQELKPQQIQKLEVALAASIAAGIVQARRQIGVRP